MQSARVIWPRKHTRSCVLPQRTQVHMRRSKDRSCLVLRAVGREMSSRGHSSCLEKHCLIGFSNQNFQNSFIKT